jgi:hypothetical protein
MALETESVILDSSRIGLYILPKYKRKTISTPALNSPRSAKRKAQKFFHPDWQFTLTGRPRRFEASAGAGIPRRPEKSRRN